MTLSFYCVFTHLPAHPADNFFRDQAIELGSPFHLFVCFCDIKVLLRYKFLPSDSFICVSNSMVLSIFIELYNPHHDQF